MYQLFENVEYTFHTQLCRCDCNTAASTVICICGWRSVMDQGKLGTFFFFFVLSHHKTSAASHMSLQIQSTEQMFHQKFKMVEMIVKFTQKNTTGSW